jgi:cytochrome P450
VTHDLSDPDTYANGFPYNVFRDLRATEPVSWRQERGGGGFWAVTRYHDAVQVLRTPSTYSSWRGSVLLADPPLAFLDQLRLSMMNSDPPAHTWLRRTVNKALNPRRIEKLDAKVSHHARELVTRMGANGECEFVSEVAEEMPLFMISEILGVPAEDRHALFPLTVRMFASEHVEVKASAAAEMRAYGADLRRRKRGAPADDLASELLAAEVDGRRLTDDEFDAFFMLLFNAGTDTTRCLLSYGLDLLLDRPETLVQLRTSPSLLPQAIEEMLRYESPVIHIRRTAVRDTELAGTRIREGEKVVVFFPSANRDETVFVDADRFDIERSPNDHIAFGFGAHHCLGAPLARLEARHVFHEILLQLGHVERIEPAVPVRSNFVRGLRQLRIRCGTL